MATTAKTFAEVNAVKSINPTDTICLAGANGALAKITLADLRNAILQGKNMEMSTDGVFILYYDETSRDDAKQVAVDEWPALQRQGRTAAGVVVYAGDRHIIVAPTENPGSHTWDTNGVDGGTTKIGNAEDAYAAYNGRATTTIQLKKAELQVETTAVGWCNKYSRANKNGKGLLAGEWWLPSIGEVVIMYANQKKINYALSLINGAQALGSRYWSCTESSAGEAWGMFFNNGITAKWMVKKTDILGVRAVSSFAR